MRKRALSNSFSFKKIKFFEKSSDYSVLASKSRSFLPFFPKTKLKFSSKTVDPEPLAARQTLLNPAILSNRPTRATVPFVAIDAAVATFLIKTTVATNFNGKIFKFG